MTGLYLLIGIIFAFFLLGQAIKRKGPKSFTKEELNELQGRDADGTFNIRPVFHPMAQAVNPYYNDEN